MRTLHSFLPLLMYIPKLAPLSLTPPPITPHTAVHRLLNFLSHSYSPPYSLDLVVVSLRHMLSPYHSLSVPHSLLSPTPLAHLFFSYIVCLSVTRSLTLPFSPSHSLPFLSRTPTFTYIHCTLLSLCRTRTALFLLSSSTPATRSTYSMSLWHGELYMYS